ncbi:MAG: heme exporter protein CcmB [Myxococcales bacterium]|nr:heme exporter protein CcmB [Myxococcales bacterium]
MTVKNPYLRVTLAMFHKDFMVEMRSREVLLTMTFFAILVVVVFTFAFYVHGDVSRQYLPGVFWVAIIFSGTISLLRTFERERENDCIRALLLSPTPPSAIYISKTLANIVFTLVMEACLVPIVVVFFNVGSLPDPARFLAILFLGTIGFCAVGTLFSAMLINARMKAVLLPLIFYPVIAPLLITCVKATFSIFAGGDVDQINRWLTMALAFDMLFIVLGLWVFGHLVGEG